MARIPDEVVERLKREVSLEQLVRASGIELKKHGDNLIGHCPFHVDRTPSFVVTPSKNLWHCLGACQAGGSVIDFVMRREKCSPRAAMEMLLKNAPILAAPLDARPARTTHAKLEEIVRSEEPDGVVLGRVVEFYHSALKEGPEALGYLESRGLHSAELITAFKLGYANRTLGYRLPSMQVKAGAAMRGHLQQLGLMRETGHELFHGSVVVPIFDADGQVVEMYGRKITARLRAGTPNHLYLPGPHRGILNAQAFTMGGEIILCEAIFDALTFWSAGFTNVTTSYGVEGFTPELREAFKAHGPKRVLIAYDRDEAGDGAAQKLSSELAAMGHEVFRVLFPRGMDANEYAQKLQPATKSLETALKAAHWMAGSRPVLVPREQVHAQAKNTVEAERASAASPTSTKLPPQTSGAEDSKVWHQADEVGASADVVPSSPIPSLAALSEVDDGSTSAGLSNNTQVDADAPHQAAEPPSSASSSSSTPAPTAPAAQVSMHDGEVTLRFGPRTWRVRGLEKVTSASSIKVNVRVNAAHGYFMDSLDVCAHRPRAAFLKQASEELELEERVLKQDLGKVLNALEGLVEKQLRKLLEPLAQTPSMTDADETAAMGLLKDPQLLARVLADFDRCGVVGEETNKLVAYLAATSRKLHDPLALVIQSSSAAGKSSLMDAVLRFIPEEEKAAYAAMTGQALFYMGETNLQHKVLAIAEEQGAKNASYALKILQSSGELTIASTGKDEATGKLTTHEYRVTGPVMIMMTTTAPEVDDELLNRCLVVSVDEGGEQTRAIHTRQREAETLEGMAAQAEEQRIFKLHQNAQRLLKPVRVVNPFAKELSFASHATRTRRDHKKYLSLIRAIALLHQYQRPQKEYSDERTNTRFRYIEATREDVALADRLCGLVLARSLDELASQTRRLLEGITALVAQRAVRDGVERDDVRFTQRELRDFVSWSATQVKVQLKRLVELEYVTMHAHKEHRQRLSYGLICGYDSNRSGNSADRSGTGPGENGPVLSSTLKALAQPVRDFAGTAPGSRVNGAPYMDASSRSYSSSSSPDAAE